MATLEDKILGEKLQNYCSSSEDEGSEDENSRSGGEEEKSSETCTVSADPTPVNNWNGTASNTGPKGVLEDWRKFRQMEAEHRAELAKERFAIAKKLTMTVKTEREEEKTKETDELEDELIELLDEDFLMQYQQKRMKELMTQLEKLPKFGKVIKLKNHKMFLHAVDKENLNVTVIVHIFNVYVQACGSMENALNKLATDYPYVKFCSISADAALLSRKFCFEGVPALLVYKGGQMIGNYVKLANEFGNDFDHGEVLQFLQEHGLLPEN